MRLSVATLIACFVLALGLSARSASAVEIKKETKAPQTVVAGVTELGQPPNVPAEELGKPPKPPKPPKAHKPKKSKKNDGKDGDPDDGDAGKGNDGKKKKHDGPEND